MQYIVYALIIWVVILLTMVPMLLFIISLLYLATLLGKTFICKFKNKKLSINRTRFEIAVFTSIIGGIYIFLILNFMPGKGADIGGLFVISPDGEHEARVANPGYCGVLCDFNPSIIIKERGRWLNHSKTVASFYKVHPESLTVEWEGAKKLIVYSTGNKSTCLDFSKYKAENLWKDITIEYISCSKIIKSQYMFLKVLQTFTK